LGNTTFVFLDDFLFRVVATVMLIFSFCAQASCANGLSTLMAMTSAVHARVGVGRR